MRSIHISVLALVACATAKLAVAYDIFLKPAAHIAAPQSALKVTLINGTFEKSYGPVPRDRMLDVSLVGGGKVIHPAASSWSDADDASHLQVQLDGAGTYVLGVASKSKIFEWPAHDFDEYLEFHGIEDVLAARRAAGPSREKIKFRFSRSTRTFIQVGDKRTADYATNLKYPIEVTLARNPADVRLGGELPFSVSFQGQPLAQQLVYAGYESHEQDDDGHHGQHDDGRGQHDDEQDRTHHAQKLRTDAQGRGTLKLTHPGRWYISVNRMHQVADGEADYDQQSGVLTFEVR